MINTFNWQANCSFKIQIITYVYSKVMDKFPTKLGYTRLILLVTDSILARFAEYDHTALHKVKHNIRLSRLIIDQI